MTKRVRIFFINCPSLATDAASFLILAQNAVQSTLQFEVHHFWIYGVGSQGALKGIWNKFLSKPEVRFHANSPWRERRYRKKLDLRAAPFFSSTIPLKEEKWETVRGIIKDYDNWFKTSGRNTYDFHDDDPVIIITETPIWGKYVSLSTSGISILGTADWKDIMGSGSASALEYILTGVQRLSLRLSYGAVIGSHYPTRGCLWDFDVHQPDLKISTFLGYLCDVCRQGLKRSITVEAFDEISALLKNNWIGKESKPSSIAGILKKDYKYVLSRSTGLRPGVISVITDSMKSEFGKFFVEIIKWALIILITLFFLTYFPALTEKWRNLMNGTPTVSTNSNTNTASNSDPNANEANSVSTTP